MPAPRRAKTPPPPPKKTIPYLGYFDEEHVKQREEILAITQRDAVWKCKGFADMVVAKGFMAVGPPERKGGVPRSWQNIGRKLFGEETFNTAIKAAVQRRLAARQASQQEKSSASC